MSLLVGQLIYTTLPNTGFQLLVSQQIPLDIQDVFVQEIVYQYWDVYNPPDANYQAVYIHQISKTHTLFGWLYNDGNDELGRAHIPYFLSYYLQKKLDEAQLEEIFRYLELGPVNFIERQYLSSELENIIVPEVDQYQSPRSSLVIPQKTKDKTRKDLKTGKVLTLLVSSNQAIVAAEFLAKEKSNEITEVPFSEIITTNGVKEIGTITVKSNKSKLSQLEYPSALNPSQIERIFQTVIQEKMGIQGAILVSEEGQALTQAIGIDQDQALMMANKMLALAKTSQIEMEWENLEAIAIHSPEGHLMLTPCLKEGFLFVQANKILTGLLEVEIKRMVKKIQSIYQNNEMFVPFSPVWDELEDEEMNELLADSDEEILYRGRRISQ